MIQEAFYRVLDQYLVEKQNKFKANPLAVFIRRELASIVRKESQFSKVFKVKASPGAGNWAEVPWLAVLDLDITKTPEKGFYIVYLFDADMGGVHLSLNQGWVQYEKKYKKNMKKARVEIAKVTSFLQEQLKSSILDFSIAPINLHARNNLGVGYQLGHICGKYYPKGAFPSDQVFLEDLRQMMKIYGELKGITGSSVLDLSNIQFHPETFDLVNAHYTPDMEVTEMQLEDIPQEEGQRISSDKKNLFDEEKQLEKNKRNKKVGDSAEMVVFEAERYRLRNLGKIDLANKVEIVSLDMNKGYDILSFEENGTEKYIEVKGTQTEILSFFLSAHEKDKSKDLGNYYIYVVHKLGSEKPYISFIHQPDFDSSKFLLKPRSYLVKYKLKK